MAGNSRTRYATHHAKHARRIEACSRGIRRLGRGGNVAPHLRGALRVADVPGAHAGVEVRGERQPAVVRIAEVFLDRMGAEALATSAVIAARVFLTRRGVDPERGENHGALPWI